MTPSSAKPSSGCAPGSRAPLLLQRRLSSGDCAKWRTVLPLQQARQSLALVALAQQIDPCTEWRVVDNPTED